MQPQENELQAKTPREPAVSGGGFFSSAWADVAGTVLTLGAGAIAAMRAINKSFYQNIKIEEKFKTIIDDSKSATRGLLHTVEGIAGEAEKRRHIVDVLPKIHLAHEGEIAKTLAESYGIRNVFDKIRLLRPHQKLEVGFNVLATMAVTLGAVVTIASSRRVSDQQDKLEKRLDGIESAQGR